MLNMRNRDGLAMNGSYCLVMCGQAELRNIYNSKCMNRME